VQFRIRPLAATAGLLTALAAGVSPANAAYTITFSQVGSDVVASGSGSLDLAGLSPDGGGTVADEFLYPAGGLDFIGGSVGASVSNYVGFTGPASFGAAVISYPESASGDTGRYQRLQHRDHRAGQLCFG
jgi:hypothetical protein